VSKTRPVYDANGRLVSKTLLTPADVPARLTKYQYSSGNISVQEEYQYNGAIPELERKMSYDDFDTKINPYKDLGASVPPYSINRNNVLKITATDYINNPGTPMTSVNNSIYNEYTRNGLPLKVTENGASFVYEYK
jgi:hypothetical protein